MHFGSQDYERLARETPGLRVAAALALPGVLQVREVSLGCTGPGCYRNREGDILMPRLAIPRLGALKLERLSRWGAAR